ncbi:uncharacterized protein LOC143264100 [Megachile rotundata]|uniref:uncharacterized protein LOC143264100 n=1 Tax=Megachile rotundata TaxID=143995 RepID=UPI003FCEFCDA
MDVSPVTSKTALIQYVAKYTSKPENSRSESFKQLIEALVNQTDSGSSTTLIRRIMIKAIGRDLSAQEACHLLLECSLVESSRTFVNLRTDNNIWININEISAEESDELSSSHICKYRNRPNRLSHLTLFQFTRTITVYKRNGRTRYGNRRNPAVVMIWPKFELGKGHNEKYYEQQLLFHYAHSNVNELKNEHETWEEAFNRQNFTPLNNQINWNEVEEEFEEETADFNDQVYLDWMALNAAGPSGDMLDVELGRRDLDIDNDWNASYHSHDNIPQMEVFAASLRENANDEESALEQMPSFSLSEEQNVIIQQLIKQLNNENAPQCSIIQGPAGSGKSAVIQAMKATCDQHRISNKKEYLCIAPTG